MNLERLKTLAVIKPSISDMTREELIEHIRIVSISRATRKKYDRNERVEDDDSDGDGFTTRARARTTKKKPVAKPKNLDDLVNSMSVEELEKLMKRLGDS